MSARSEAVDRYLADLDHPSKPKIEWLREEILKANPGIEERIK